MMLMRVYLGSGVLNSGLCIQIRGMSALTATSLWLKSVMSAFLETEKRACEMCQPKPYKLSRHQILRFLPG